MVLERSVGRDKLAASQLEYSIKLNDTNDAALEVRGLMVIKQTKKTRAKQRKQAIHHWKTIGRKVIHTIAKVGKEQAVLLLHGHDRLDPIIEDDKTPSWNRTPTRMLSRSRPRSMVSQAAAEVKTDDPVSHMHLSAPSSTQQAIDWHPVEATADPDVGVHEETVIVVSHRFAMASLTHSDSQRNMRIRGVEMVPSGDIPNMPTSTPPNRAVSPKIRHDMFRRKSPSSGGSENS
ncbi:unnamed protein product [Strongylus vulgaris]|uniref:Uncharacterized protein n=1 Tax=Strongylus vulgaris TaxID=40348 RepID=A0A3P7IBJ9_STRVU|nr:unnamed protein product [Strongylus vulgaris]